MHRLRRLGAEPGLTQSRKIVPPETLEEARTHGRKSEARVIKLYKEGERISYMKAQCMHCVDPACAGACMLGSLHKDEVTGVVTRAHKSFYRLGVEMAE